MNREIRRCQWVNLKNPIYIQYHDTEWGVPEHDDQKLYELLLLESFQAGLSWECVLNKRENFRAAYDDFDIEKVCNYDEAKCAELLNDPGIIRNRLKVKASVTNSRIFREIQRKFGSFDAYIWGFTDGKVVFEDYSIRTTSPLSDQISKDLKKRGMTFVGSTVIYSYLQAIGIINGHGKECDHYMEGITHER
ncbi:DNA-3-methyladenine glycosylase I [uncultured Dysosmobacter sp.]|uniref:DNA-3-methyladenine glycosylase I n=1 Tax=uncultured Dysosmobacter sp. TaxID=2591384 RepID=UPI00261C39CC|nr:DNA-3-methyladenine glycosylase I [uncultured Dysosmobacter sp.]